MTETNEQILHRLKMILDDSKALRKFIYENNLIEQFRKKSAQCEEAITHLNNIDIACDLTSDECLTWKEFSK